MVRLVAVAHTVDCVDLRAVDRAVDRAVGDAEAEVRGMHRFLGKDVMLHEKALADEGRLGSTNHGQTIGRARGRDASNQNGARAACGLAPARALARRDKRRRRILCVPCRLGVPAGAG